MFMQKRIDQNREVLIIVFVCITNVYGNYTYYSTSYFLIVFDFSVRFNLNVM